MSIISLAPPCAVLSVLDLKEEGFPLGAETHQVGLLCPTPCGFAVGFREWIATNFPRKSPSQQFVSTRPKAARAVQGLTALVASMRAPKPPKSGRKVQTGR